MTSASHTLFLLDGHAQLYRAYHAIRPGTMHAPDGTPTNAVFGFTQMLRATRNRFKPNYLAAVFDPPEPSFRAKEYAEYKAHRAPMPDDLRPQVSLAADICRAYGFPVFIVPTFEADDVLGTLAQAAAAENLNVVIVSGDKDLLQLVTDKIHVFDPSPNKETLYTPEEVVNKKGLRPNQIADWLGLMGDASDNIPGVQNVGEKTAKELLLQHDTLEAVLEYYNDRLEDRDEEMRGFVAKHRAEAAKPKDQRVPVKTPKGIKVLEAYLYVQAEQARASRELARIRTNVDVKLDLETCRCAPPNADKLRPLLLRLGFAGLLRELDAANKPPAQSVEPVEPVEPVGPVESFETAASVSVPTRQTGASLWDDSAAENPSDSSSASAAVEIVAPRPTETPAVGLEVFSNADYHLVDTPDALAEFAGHLARQRRFAVDTETTSVRPHQALLVGLAFSWKTGEAWYLPVRGPGGSKFLDEQTTLQLLRPILEDPTVEKIGQHLKYDLQVLRKHGVELRGIAFDTMLAGWLLAPNANSHGLDALCYEHLRRRKIPTTDLIGRGKSQTTMDLVPIAQVAEYACEDAAAVFMLAEVLAAKLAEANLDKLFREIEMPLSQVLADMEWTGIAVDRELLRKMSVALAEQLAEGEAAIQEAAGEKFNPNSPKQLGAILFEKMGIKSRGRTAKSGAYATDESVLRELADEGHELPRLILEYRTLAKLKGTYVDALPELTDPQTGRVHASFRQTGTETGRLSSSDPNLQNIPIREELGRSIRAAFRAGTPGWKIISADYAQIELRMLAHYSRDEALLTAFAEGQDIHAAVAARLYGVKVEDVTREQRGRAKTVNFGILYGQTAFGLAQTLGLSRGEAQKIIDAYFSGHPGVRDCLAQIVADAEQKGYVTTLLGRRRFVPQLAAKDANTRKFGERIAVNTVFQGSAADLIKQAMIDLHRTLNDPKKKWKTALLLQIHDELLLETPPDEVEAAKELVKTKMENALPLVVKPIVEVCCGDDWLAAKP